MPLARIITDSVDESLELTMQLRSRGFQVETVAPGEVPRTPADLEVRLEECASEDVLARTAQVSEGDDLWVFVAPGALDERARPVRTIPLEPLAPRPSEEKTASPRKRLLAPAIPSCMAPEDDPILLELMELNQSPSTAGSADARSAIVNKVLGAHALAPTSLPAPHPQLVEHPPVSGEVVAFPRTETQAHVRRSTGSVPSPSAELRFWRIACVTAGLAVAALLVGVHLSREPQPAASVPQAKALLASSPNLPTGGRSTPYKSRVVAPAKPSAGAVAVAKQAAASRPGGLAKMTVRVHKPPATRRVAPRSDDVASDTIVYFDRNGRRVARRPTPNKEHSSLN
jgi:hypothetical protein